MSNDNTGRAYSRSLSELWEIAIEKDAKTIRSLTNECERLRKVIAEVIENNAELQSTIEKLKGGQMDV